MVENLNLYQNCTLCRLFWNIETKRKAIYLIYSTDSDNRVVRVMHKTVIINSYKYLNAYINVTTLYCFFSIHMDVYNVQNTPLVHSLCNFWATSGIIYQMLITIRHHTHHLMKTDIVHGKWDICCFMPEVLTWPLV